MRARRNHGDGYDHVILVSLDTLRSDCIGATPWRLWQRRYPDITRRPPTRLLDQIVDRSAFFPNTITVTPYTAGAHAAAITGRWPLRNGVWEQFNRGLRVRSLFHRARRLGYRTLLKSDFPVMLGPSLGFTAAVDEYIEEDDGRFIDALAASRRSVSLVHFGSMHVPYGFLNLRTGGGRYRERVAELEEQYRPQVAMPVDRLAEALLTEDDWNLLFRYKRIIQELVSTQRYGDVFGLYLEGVGHFLEARFEPFWERLGAALRGSRSLVVLFSDHGEEYDEVSYGHFNSIAEGVVRVPLSFWGDDVRPRLHPGRVSCVDIAPTVLALLGDPDAGRLDLDGEPLTRSHPLPAAVLRDGPEDGAPPAPPPEGGPVQRGCSAHARAFRPQPHGSVRADGAGRSGGAGAAGHGPGGRQRQRRAGPAGAAARRVQRAAAGRDRRRAPGRSHQVISIPLPAGGSSALARLAERAEQPAWLVSVAALAVVLQRMTYAGGVTLDVEHEAQPARRLVLRASHRQDGC